MKVRRILQNPTITTHPHQIKQVQVDNLITDRKQRVHKGNVLTVQFALNAVSCQTADNTESKLFLDISILVLRMCYFRSGKG